MVHRAGRMAALLLLNLLSAYAKMFYAMLFQTDFYMLMKEQISSA